MGQTNERVLVVEDDPDLAEVMLMSLEQAGYPARVAHDGSAALREVERTMPELILLDMRMPVMDGREFARAFRERHGAGVPIVAITAAEHATAFAREIGADEALSKPFELARLLDTVARYVR